jgi:type IV pilus assembly protein PilW
VGEGQLALGSAGLTNLARDCITPAPIYRYLSRLYYVTDNDELARMEMGADGDYESSGPLVDGIEALHVSFGIDSADSDGVVDSYTDAPTNAQLGNVIAVRFWVVARNLQPTQGYTDERDYQLGDLVYVKPAAFLNHKRQVYSTVVTLRNVAGAREVQ